MLKKILKKFNNFNKRNLLINFLFVLLVSVVYSLSVNIPLIEMQYPNEYFILALVVSILRDYIIWFIAFLNRWVFAVFTSFTFVAGFGLMYMNKYLNMGLSTGNFEIILATNLNEAKGVLNATLITFFAIGLLLAVMFISIRFNLHKIFSSYNSTSKRGGETGFYFSSH